MPVERWLEADVVVDVANLAHAVADARGLRGRREPSLVVLAHLLDRIGIGVRSFTVALPTRPFVGVGRSLADLRPTGGGDDAEGGDGDVAARDWVQRRLDAGAAWVARERRTLAAADLPAPRVVGGALAGLGRGSEVGVDELAALAALHLVWDIPAEAATPGPDRPSRGVVLVSEDRDVAAVAEVAAGRPLHLLGTHSRDASRRARRREDGGARPWLLVPSAAVAALGERRVSAGRAAVDAALADVTVGPGADADDGEVRLRLGPARNEAASAPLPSAPPTFAAADTWEGRRRAVADGAATVAVVDEYGLLRAGMRALGAAFLPEPDDVRGVLHDHVLFPGEVAQFAVVPDVRDLAGIHADEDGDAGARTHASFVDRDHELDANADRYARDGRAAIDRSDLRVVREGQRRDAAARFRLEEKRTVTLLAANVLWALRSTPAQVVLLSDRAVLADVLERLADVAPDLDAQAELRAAVSARLTRVGLHADPWRAEGRIATETTAARSPTSPARAGGDAERDRGRRRLTLDDLGPGSGDLLDLLGLGQRDVGTPHVVVLDGELSGRLLGVADSPYGPDRLVRLHRALADPRTLVEMVGLDPDDDGLRLRLLDGSSSAEEQALEVLLAGAFALDPEVIAHVEAATTVEDLRQRLDVHLRGARNLPCSMPTLRAPAGAEGEDPPPLLSARIVGRTADGLVLDVDGDLTTTEDRVTIEVHHGFTAYRGASSEVLTADHDRDGRPDEIVGPARGDAGGADADGDAEAFDGLPVTATVLTADRVRLDRTADGGDAGPDELELLGVPRTRSMTAAADDRILVVPVSPTQCYGMSSPLPHLN